MGTILWQKVALLDGEADEGTEGGDTVVRLIDADALQRECQKAAIFARKMHMVTPVDMVLYYVIDFIDDFPAVLSGVPRVMPLEELPTWDGAFLIETRMNGETVWASWYSEYEQYDQTICRMQDIDGEVDDRFKKLYGYDWRCWTSRPTEEQREAAEWDEAD